MPIPKRKLFRVTVYSGSFDGKASELCGSHLNFLDYFTIWYPEFRIFWAPKALHENLSGLRPRKTNKGFYVGKAAVSASVSIGVYVAAISCFYALSASFGVFDPIFWCLFLQ